MRTTNKLTPCFVSRFPVWVKIAIDTVVLTVVRGVGWRGGVGAKGWFLFHKKLQQFCRICQREWGFVCLSFESMTHTPERFSAFRSQKCREVPTITPQDDFVRDFAGEKVQHTSGPVLCFCTQMKCVACPRNDMFSIKRPPYLHLFSHPYHPSPRCSPTTDPTPTTPPHNRATQKEDNMEVVIKDCADNSYVIEVGVDDTTETMRQKVASAVGLAEDSFHMGFGGKDEGDDITQLSAGDAIILTESKKFVARAALHALGEDITAVRLVTVEDPEVACLLLQAEVATVIPNKFLAQTSLTALDLSAVSCVTEIGDDFLHHCTTLTSIDLSGLTRVTRIGTHFVAQCSSLTAVDLSLLRNVTHISTRFLYNCTSLTSVDLSPLRNVRQIDYWFLSNCTSLTSVDLSPLRNITQIDGHFLAYCTSLKVVDLSPLCNVTQVGTNFLTFCRSLTELDLSPLSRVTFFGEQLAYNCTSLRSIHLAGCSSAVSSRVREGDLKEYVVDARPRCSVSQRATSEATEGRRAAPL